MVRPVDGPQEAREQGQGTVRHLAHMGSDLNIVNAARASFLKESSRLTAADTGLIRFLAEARPTPHESPFRHVAVRFQVVSSLRDRLRWEGGDDRDRAGMVFVPSLAELADSPSLDGLTVWRWTASLAAAVRFVQAHSDDALEGYAAAVQRTLDLCYPVSTAALLGYQPTPLPSPHLKPQQYGEAVACLDKGYVRYVDHLAGPTPQECVLSLEIKAPLMVRSQWFKYVRRGDHCPPGFVPHPFEEWGSGNGDDGDGSDPLYARNEASRRYVTLEPEFYQPSVWYRAPESRKQGSGEPLAESDASTWDGWLAEHIRESIHAYDAANQNGVAAQQARLYLPAYGLYTVWRWTASLPAVHHFLTQRLDHAAQDEIIEYAKAVQAIVTPLFGNELAML